MYYKEYKKRTELLGLPVLTKVHWDLFWKHAHKHYDVEKLKRSYNNQFMMAIKREIEWKFNVEEWTMWWAAELGRNWQSMRGTKLGQYVMARFEDTGPYSLENIKCILATENSSEGYRPIGRNHWNYNPKRHSPLL